MAPLSLLISVSTRLLYAVPRPFLAVKSMSVPRVAAVVRLSRTAIIGLLAAGLPVASAVGQGQNTPPPAAGYATVSGTAFDSVRGGPLVGATLTVEGSFRHAISDSSGRFHIDSVEPGERRIGIFHPILDSLGIGISSPVLALRTGDVLSVALATPSPRTIAARICRNAMPPSDGQAGPVLLIGRLLDGDTEEPVASARVEVSWLHVAMTNAGLHRIQIRRAFITDPSGAFHFCQLPADIKVLIGADARCNRCGRRRRDHRCRQPSIRHWQRPRRHRHSPPARRRDDGRDLGRGTTRDGLWSGNAEKRSARSLRTGTCGRQP